MTGCTTRKLGSQIADGSANVARCVRVGQTPLVEGTEYLAQSTWIIKIHFKKGLLKTPLYIQNLRNHMKSANIGMPIHSVERR